MNRNGLLYGVGGVLAVLLLMALAAAWPRSAEAQDRDEPTTAVPAPPAPATDLSAGVAPARSQPVPAGMTEQATNRSPVTPIPGGPAVTVQVSQPAFFSDSPASARHTPAGRPPGAATPGYQPPDPLGAVQGQPLVSSSQLSLRDRLKAESIDELLNTLANLKTQKTELEKAEQEAVAVLREKLKEQRQKLERLGMQPEVGAPPQPAASIP